MDYDDDEDEEINALERKINNEKNVFFNSNLAHYKQRKLDMENNSKKIEK